MGVGGLRQAIDLDLGRAYDPRLKQFSDAFEMPAGAPNRRPERRYIVAFWLWRLRPRSDKGRATARLEHREGSLRHVGTDRIEDGVAIGDNLSKIAGVVVDDFIGSDSTYIFMVCRTRGRDHPGAYMLSKLNGEAGNAACSTLDQDRLPGLQFQCILDRAHCREAGERQGGSFNM